MKRAAAFITLAFFVFLNSGMFVCAVHCGVQKLVTKPKAQMACNRSKPCCNEKSSDCPKKHGNFSIKENIQPGYSIRLHSPLLTLNYSPFACPNLLEKTVRPQYNLSVFIGKAPPGSGRSIAVKFHSLLI